MKRSRSRAKRLAGRALLAAAAAVAALLAAEVGLRLWRPHGAFGAGWELHWTRRNESTRLYTVDPEFGFRPILATDLFSRYGTRVNDYPIAKAAGKRRLLFVGDSVTFRGKIVEAIRRAYGQERFEYWNAGVESFNTVQEVRYYRRYNAAIRPDHVIVSFHLNDLETTPVAFVNREGRLVVYAPHVPLRRVSPWLFAHSYVYRLLLGAMIEDRRGRAQIVQEVRRHLAELRDCLAADGIALTVLVLPMFRPTEEWRPEEAEARRTILRVLADLQVRHFDLLEPLNEALADGVVVQEAPTDPCHPSEAAAERFAAYLRRRGLLSEAATQPAGRGAQR